MNRKDHIKADLFLLGYTMPDVHRLTDDIEAIQKYGPRHRIMRHNPDWLSFIKEQFGKKAFYVALLHILIDMDIVMDRKKLKMYLEEYYKYCRN